MFELAIGDMSKKLTILMFVFLTGAAGFGAEAPRQGLLRDGFVIRGIDGAVSGPDSNDMWFFEFGSDVSDNIAVVKKGTRLQLLPSSTLEKIAADVNERSGDAYQLWGRITKYRGRNFIFPVFFLPLSKMKQPQLLEPPQPQKSEPNEPPPSPEKYMDEPVINEPNDILAVPQEIVEKLDARRIETSKRPALEVVKRPSADSSGQDAGRIFQQDTVLADRTGFILSHTMDGALRAEKNIQYGFVFDALGRKIPKMSYRLLPCEALELAEQGQSAELETLQFRVAGIVTEYKDQNYLLLQKATQVFSYGNFAR